MDVEGELQWRGVARIWRVAASRALRSLQHHSANAFQLLFSFSFLSMDSRGSKRTLKTRFVELFKLRQDAHRFRELSLIAQDALCCSASVRIMSSLLCTPRGQYWSLQTAVASSRRPERTSSSPTSRLEGDSLGSRA